MMTAHPWGAGREGPECLLDVLCRSRLVLCGGVPVPALPCGKSLGRKLELLQGRGDEVAGLLQSQACCASP